ncbi:MAG TPA: GNAT family N-acetyltransferase [Mycobacteriales bacterium]|nr:GNAT family N-acetyltransferase [Mycobacteriales bacterium]
MTVPIRDAQQHDADACAAIYRPYVTDTAISFETEPPTPAQMCERIQQARHTHAWLVAETEGRVVGYAYGGPFKTRAAYQWSCEVSVYLDREHRGRGIGRALYTELFERLADRGYQTAFAGMTLPNPASHGLHRAMGFEPAGVYRGVGWKNGSWHDVAWFQRPLAPAGSPPAQLR